MESKLGKVVLENNRNYPMLVIAEKGHYLKGLKLVRDASLCNSDEKFSQVTLTEEEITKIAYRGKKLNNVIVDCHHCSSITNLNFREIGKLTEDAYYKVLRRYISYQAYLGATNPSYLGVRTEVQEQLIKTFK